MSNWSEADLAAYEARRQQGRELTRQQLVAAIRDAPPQSPELVKGRGAEVVSRVAPDGAQNRGSITIRIPGPPVAKARPRLGRGGNVFTPRETALWERQAKFAARCQMGELPPVEGAVSVIVTAHIEPPKSWSKKRQDAAHAGQIMPTSRPDIDNYLKAALDALNEVVWRDDSQVVEARIRKAYAEGAGVTVVVEMA